MINMHMIREFLNSLVYDNNMCEGSFKWIFLIYREHLKVYKEKRSWRRDEMKIIVKQKQEREKEKSVGYRVMISKWEEGERERKEIQL